MNKEMLFTVEMGIEIQSRQLKGWKRKLLPEVYTALEMFAITQNNKAQNGYQVVHGNMLDVFVAKNGGYES